MSIGEIPLSLSLLTLNLSGNYLSSLDPATSLQNLPNLQLLDLSANSFITLGMFQRF